MVTAAALEALGVKGLEVATIEDVVDAEWQVVTVEGVGIAMAHLSPGIGHVVALDDAIDVGGGYIIHVTANDDIAGRLVDGLSDGLGMAGTQREGTFHAFQGNRLDIGRDADIHVLADRMIATANEESEKLLLSLPDVSDADKKRIQMMYVRFAKKMANDYLYKVKADNPLDDVKVFLKCLSPQSCRSVRLASQNAAESPAKRK